MNRMSQEDVSKRRFKARRWEYLGSYSGRKIEPSRIKLEISKSNYWHNYNASM